MGELTLDTEEYLYDLFEDALNERVIYATGVTTDDPHDLQMTMDQFGPTEGVRLLPQQKKRKHAFVSECAVAEVPLQQQATVV